MTDNVSLMDFIDQPASAAVETAPPSGDVVNTAPASTASTETVVPEGVSAEEPTWWYDEGVPGKGDKPDYYDNKTFPTLAAQARKENVMRKKMATFEGAPEGYEVRLSEELSDYDVDPNDPIIKGLQQFAKEKNMPQKYFDEAVDMIAKMSIEAQKQEDEEVQEYFMNEVKSLGSDGQKQVTDLVKWMQSNFDDFDMEKDRFLLNSAASIRRLQSIKNKMEASQRLPISPPNANKVPLKSQYELDAMLNDPRYLKDVTYRKEVDDMWRLKLGEKR